MIGTLWDNGKCKTGAPNAGALVAAEHARKAVLSIQNCIVNKVGDCAPFISGMSPPFRKQSKYISDGMNKFDCKTEGFRSNWTESGKQAS